MYRPGAAYLHGFAHADGSQGMTEGQLWKATSAQGPSKAGRNQGQVLSSFAGLAVAMI